MAAKFDQEALKKHHFWILLGVTLPLILVALIFIWAGVSSAVADEEKKIKAANDKIASRDFKTKPYLHKLEHQQGVVDGHRGKVWQAAWNKQAGLIAFPGNPRDYFPNPSRYLYFGTEIDRDDRDHFAENSPDYADAWAALPKLVEPTDLAPNWDANNFPRTTWTSIPPSSEDVWLAVEDLCVVHEVLENVHTANLAVAHFEPADMALGLVYCGTPPDTTKNQRFRRQYRCRLWDLDLILSPKSSREVTFSGTMKNVSGRRLKVTQLGLIVHVSSNPNNPPLKVPLQPTQLTEYVPAGETITLKPSTVTLSSTLEDLYSVDLLLTPENVPVRRVEMVALGAAGLSHRHADKAASLLMSSFSEKLAGPAEGTKEGSESGNDITGMKMSSGSGKPSAPGAIGPDGAGASNGTMLSPNGFVRQRYLQRTDQVRRLPIRMQVLVDEAFIQDVLVALANSKLRLQITQVEWERARDAQLVGLENNGAGPNSMGPTSPSGPGEMALGGPRGSAARSGGKLGAGRTGGGVSPVMPAGGMPMPGPPGGSGAAQPEFPGFPGFGQRGSAGSNFYEPPPATLVVLSVYGVASLYERPKPADANTTKPEEKK